MRYIRFKKLEQFCLHVIVENLEKFIYSKNVPQKHIDFLLRVYSEEVFKKFSHREQVSEDCMLWFLNPHSKKVQLTTVSEKIASQLQIVGSIITSLSLKDLLASESMIDAIISSIPNIIHLDLSNSQCTDNTMLCIQRMCPLLISLYLSKCKITCKGLERLVGIHQSLKILDITRNHIDVCAVLKMFPQLEQLKTEGMAEKLHVIHEQTYTSTNIRYNLTELICDKNCPKSFDRYLKILHAWTVLCPYVTRVYIGHHVTQAHIEMCSRFQYLKVFEINDKITCTFPTCKRARFVNEDMKYDTDDLLAPFLPKQSRLTKIVLSNVKISIKTLMECFENLKTLYLKNVCFTEFREDDLTLKDNKLEVLVLKQIRFDLPDTCRAILSLISVSTNVTSLHLINIGLPQTACDAILNSMKILSYIRFTAFVPLQSLFCMEIFFRRIFQIPSLEVCVIVESLHFKSLNLHRAKLPIHTFPSTTTSNTLSWFRCDYDSEDSDDESYESTEDSDSDDSDDTS